MWDKRPCVELLQAKLTASCRVFEARVVWSNRESYRRKFVFDPQLRHMEIEDSWDWDGPGPVAINFCIAPGLPASQVSEAIVVRAEGFRITIRNRSLDGELNDARVSALLLRENDPSVPLQFRRTHRPGDDRDFMGLRVIDRSAWPLLPVIRNVHPDIGTIRPRLTWSGGFPAQDPPSGISDGIGVVLANQG